MNPGLMMTGMSCKAESDMMQARNSLKLMAHQQTTIQARIIKLAKEEEKANKRIRDMEQKATFAE